MPRGYGGKSVPKKEKSGAELIEHMKRYGNLQTLPGTGRQVHIKTVDARDLLRDDKLPDILTPLVIKSVYNDLRDRDVRDFMSQARNTKQEALDFLDSVDYVVEKALVSGAKLNDLTPSERRWIFQLVMTPAELLVTFRLEEDDALEPVAEGEDVREATE